MIEELNPLEQKIIANIRNIEYGELSFRIKVQNGLAMVVEESESKDGIRATRQYQAGMKKMND